MSGDWALMVAPTRSTKVRPKDFLEDRNHARIKTPRAGMMGRGDQRDRRKVWDVRSTLEALKLQRGQSTRWAGCFQMFCVVRDLSDIRMMGIENLQGRHVVHNSIVINLRAAHGDGSRDTEDG